MSGQEYNMRMIMEFIKWIPLPLGWKSNITCFFQAKFCIGSLVIVFNKKGEVLLFHHTYRNNPWGLPGGYIGKREHPKVSIKREVFEESGLKISKLKQIALKLDKDLSRLQVFYIAKECIGKFRPSAEVSKAQYFDINKLPALPYRQKELIIKAYSKRS